MKLLLYGDIHAANLYSFNVKRSKYHIAEYSRIDELYSTLEWIAKATKDNDVMMTVNMGDTFHQALRFYVERYNTVVKAVNAINQHSLSKSGVILEGNHDRSEDVSAVDTFENVQGTILVKNSIKVKYVSEIQSQLIFVPYIRDPEKTRQVFNALYEKYRNKANQTNLYIFCHLDIKEAYEGLVQSTYQLAQYNAYDDLKLHIYKAIFSGHIHFKKNIKNNFFYIGSVLNHNFSSSPTIRKGITVVSIDPDGYKMDFKENPFCPLFVKFNLENPSECSKKIAKIEEELKKFPGSNVYARLYSLSSEEGRKKISEFLRDFGHLFTANDVKTLGSEEELRESEAMSSTMGEVNVFDLIVEHGSKILRSRGKKQEEIEEYIMRLKKVCHLN
jgi:DNA repair exonuclease SbcCD nuclease subunit